MRFFMNIHSQINAKKAFVLWLFLTVCIEFVTSAVGYFYHVRAECTCRILPIKCIGLLFKLLLVFIRIFMNIHPQVIVQHAFVYYFLILKTAVRGGPYSFQCPKYAVFTSPFLRLNHTFGNHLYIFKNILHLCNCWW